MANMTIQDVCPFCNEEMQPYKRGNEVFCDKCNKKIRDEAPPATGSAASSTGATAAPAGSASTPLSATSSAARTAGDISTKIDADETQAILERSKKLKQQNYITYGLFGGAHAGKGAFIYATGKLIEKHITGYLLDNRDDWDKFYEEEERKWKTKSAEGTPKAYYDFKIQRSNNSRRTHLALIDIAGEQFEQAFKSASNLTEFFAAYVPHCAGFFVMINPFAGITPGERGELDFENAGLQLENARTFLHLISGLLALGPRIYNDPKKAIEAVHDDDFINKVTGKVKCMVPVSICFTMSDLWRCDGYKGRFNSLGLGEDPSQRPAYEFLNKIKPNGITNLLESAPYLQIKWISSLGDDFLTTQRYNDKPIGQKEVVEFVIKDRPSFWKKSSSSYSRNFFNRKP